jgi:TPP-dependent pyruvate/acetoin dehydrogenase alpha subunit
LRDECLEEFARAHGLTIRTVRVDGIDCIAFARSDAA